MYRISKEKSGRNIRRLMDRFGVTVREIQEELELESPQAVYKWLAGKSIPSIENLMILSRLLNVPIEDMLVVEQDLSEKERKRAWDKKHPSVYIAYQLRAEEAIRARDTYRFACYFEDLLQERMRTAKCQDNCN